MPRISFLLTMGVTFTFGLILGLMLHLPLAASPSSTRHIRDTRPFPPASRAAGHTASHVQTSDTILEKDSIKDSNLSSRFGSRTKESSSEKSTEGMKAAHNKAGTDGRNIKRILELRHSRSDEPLIDGSSDAERLDKSVLHIRHEEALPLLNHAPADSSQVRFSHNGDMISGTLVEGIYWSPAAEMLVPEGFTPSEDKLWRRKAEEAAITGLTEGCGRMQNRLLQLEDGSRACARYRMNTDQILGEILSYHLAMILGIHNVPPSVLRLPDARDRQWAFVRGEMAQAQWHHEKPLVLTPWLNQLSPVYIPTELRSDKHRRFHPDLDLKQRSLEDVRQLVQWSDLIIFDYLTGNLDRVVNNMYNLQWNAAMMESPTHNLDVTSEGLLVFLDNESGLLHSYRLLDKYHKYQESLLKSLCIFRRGTAEAIRALYARNNVAQVLREHFEQNEPLHKQLPRLPDKNIKILHARLKDVHDQIEYCQNIYNSR